MTVNELCDNLSIQSPLKILSAYNGKVLCYDFKPGNEKHKEIGERKIDTLWAEMRFTKSSGFGNYADSVLCAFVDGYPEHEKALKEAQPCASIGALRSRGNAVRAAEFLQGLDVALSALLPVTREQVEKVWRGEWMFPIFADQKDANDLRCQCFECGSIETPLARHRFCPSCGAPMTDEAVDMVMERLEGLHEITE